MMPGLLSFSPVTMNRMLIRSQLMHLRVYLLISCFLENAQDRLRECEEKVAAQSTEIGHINDSITALRKNTEGLEQRQRASRLSHANALLECATSDLELLREELQAAAKLVVASGIIAQWTLFQGWGAAFESAKRPPR
jgi:uncharacterized coiled-coil protein SlyX